ncbi:hypothetical protein ACHAXA_007445 [Cyclostephanos tholiformis]|uniref:CN hydrolase domain-containing protein n=1 Tax=Cyclostephanos tholiformis TaxID=382380 RepID=A0ABD3SDH8_9STRA
MSFPPQWDDDRDGGVRVVRNRVALLQMPVTIDKSINIRTAREYVLRGRNHGAEMCVLPEVHLFDVSVPGGIHFMESETLTMGDLGATYFDVLSSARNDEDVEVGGGEEDHVGGGLGRIGVGICYDIRFPEYALLLTQVHECRVLIYPGAFNLTTGPAHWELLQRARAVDGQCFVLTASPARMPPPPPPHEDMKYPHYSAWGHSSVVSPWGDVIATCDEGPAVVIADLDMNLVSQMRAAIPTMMQKRTPLHVACDHDVPAPLVQALLSAWPEGAERIGTSQMNPLHITCSSPNASVDVVRTLLAGCQDPSMITGTKDGDGDTPLHAACRIAAPNNVLETLVQANPTPITWKDYEGLNPLTRLWVRYFVLVGENIIANIKQPILAWEKSLLLLQVMVENKGREGQNQAASFRAVHAASSVDCPRCLTRIAMVISPQQLLMRDELNRLPIHIAAAAPVYCVHDLRGEGFIEEAYIDDDHQQRAARSRMKEPQSKYEEPSIIDILLSGEPAAARERDPNGQLPLHLVIMRGKAWEDGVKALAEAFPYALTTPDNKTNLYLFMLAASVGRSRGDCTSRARSSSYVS